MEAINDSTKSIAQALKLINYYIEMEYKEEERKDVPCLPDAINWLEIALDKLTNKIG